MLNELKHITDVKNRFPGKELMCLFSLSGQTLKWKLQFNLTWAPEIVEI